jgi:hypothetical protein
LGFCFDATHSGDGWSRAVVATTAARDNTEALKK